MVNRPFSPMAILCISVAIAIFAWGYYAATHRDLVRSRDSGWLISPD